MLECDNVNGEVTYGGPGTVAYEGTTLPQLMAALPVAAPHDGVVDADAVAGLAAYEAAWGVAVPPALAALASVAGVGDALALATGLVLFKPGWHPDLGWKLVAPWGAGDRRRAIAGAMQEGQGCFFCYIVFEPAAAAAAAGGGGGGASGASSTEAGGAAAATTTTTPPAPPSPPPPAPSLAVYTGMEWSELEPIAAEDDLPPAVLLRHVANDLYAYLRHAVTALGGG